MAMIYVELQPVSIELKFISCLEGEKDDGLEHERLIVLSGHQATTGTYGNQPYLNLNDDGRSIALPDFTSVVVREVEVAPEIIGGLTYLASYSDSDVGIKEPDQFTAEIEYANEQFEKLWNLIGTLSAGELKVSVAIRAPNTDISGSEAIFDVSKSHTWPINALYVSRNI